MLVRINAVVGSPNPLLKSPIFKHLLLKISTFSQPNIPNQINGTIKILPSTTTGTLGLMVPQTQNQI